MDSATPKLNNTPNKPTLPKKAILIAIIMFVVLALTLVPFLISNFSKKPDPFTPDTPKPAKSWEIIFENKDQVLTVKSVTIKNAVSIKSPFKFSPYTLTVLDKTGQTLYEDNVQINERIHVDPMITPQGSPSAELPIESMITVPYFDGAEKIQISKENLPILELIPPKKISLQLIDIAQAQNSASCKPLNLVFISDGYSDMNKYHQHVDTIKQVFSNVAPYSSKNIFSFKTIDNPSSNPLNCVAGGQLNVSCLYSISSIANLVFSRFPELPTTSGYTKFVILADALPNTDGTLGAALGVGGQIAVFETRVFSNQVTLHEVSGHAIGFLNDRYVHANPSYGLPLRARSNCTDNPAGEQFWQSLGYSSSFLGCMNRAWYAPTDNKDCINGNPGTLLSTGPRTTAMSAGGCGQPVFDAVEQEWIKTQILPNYSDVSCLLPPSPSPSPSPSPTPSPPPSLSPSPIPSGSNLTSPSLAPSASPSRAPSPIPSQTTSSPASPTGGSNGQQPADNGGIPGSENVPPGYYTDEGEEASPIPFTCREATTTNSAGQQIQLGYLICTPK